MAKTRLAQRIEAGGSIGRGMVPDGARTRSRSRQGDGVGEVAGARASAMARAIAVDGRDPFSQPYLGRSSRLICSPRASSLCARHSRCCRLRARPRALFRHISLLCILRAPGLFAPPCGKTFDFWPRNRVLARWPRAFALKARPCIVKAQVSDFDRLDASSKRA